MISDVMKLAHDLSLVLICDSAAILLTSVLRTPRHALYVPTESLLLLTIVYAYRCRDIFPDVLMDDVHLIKGVHLLLLALLTFSVNYYQRKSYLVRPSACKNLDENSENEQEERAVADLVLPQIAPTGVSASTTVSRPEEAEETCSIESQLRRPKHIRFNRSLFLNSLFWSFLPMLYVGDHSLLSRYFKSYNNEPVAPFASDLSIQLSLFFCLLEVHAIGHFIMRMIVHRRAQLLAAPFSMSTIEAAGIDLDTWKERQQIPKCLWWFMWCTQLSAALQLAWLINVVVKEGRVGLDRELNNLTGYGIQVFCWIGFLVFYKFGIKRGVQLDMDEEKQQQVPTSSGSSA